MPSRADWRRGVEWALRIALVVVLAVALWRSLRAAQPGVASESVRASTLGDALPRATTSERIGESNVSMDGTLTHADLDWLAALRRSGVRVHWHGKVPAIALSVDRAREPVARARVRLVADSGVMLVIGDSIGVIDSVRVARGASLEASDLVGLVSARHGRFGASAVVPARSDRRDVLVLGRAAWESRFVLAALGEAGWRVRGRVPVAPGVSVVDASLLPLDTSRYDVVIALDSSAADLAPALARFVGQGGGAIIAGSALGVGALRALVPARAGARRPGRILLAGDTLTRADLPLRPLIAVRDDAVPLERQPAGLVVAIRRAGRGRVAAIGYDESWRWRMEGGAAGEAAHREWWSRLVAAVAYTPVFSMTDPENRLFDEAPLASLIGALGPPVMFNPRLTPERDTGLTTRILFGVVIASLLLEWTSRRLRGAR